jgi:hypothetical protein
VFIQNPFNISFQTAIVFDSIATDGPDNCCDAIWPFGNTYLDLHTQINGQPYVINYLSFPSHETSVPLYSVANPDTGHFVIGIDMTYGNLNVFPFVKDNVTNSFHTLPYQVIGPVSGQRFTLYTTVPVNIETVNSCDQNGGKVIIHNPNSVQSTQIFKNGEPFLSTTDTIISGLESANYQYRWTHIVGQQESIEFGISNSSLEAQFLPTQVNLAIYDPILAMDVDINSPYTSITWDFGDGSPFLNNDINPIHIYQAPGIYTLTVTIVSTDGCIKILTATITVYETTNGIQTLIKQEKKYPYYYGLDGKLIKSD